VRDGAETQLVDPGPKRVLHAYLLGCLDFPALIGLQHRLVYDVAGDRDGGAVILCDHPAGITVGREGSRAHVRPGPEELTAREWPVRWVSRGGGVMLHLPGQVACYPIVALDRLGLTPTGYLARFQALVADLVREYGVAAKPDPGRPGVRVGSRRVAHVGVAVRNWVSCFGAVLNVEPDLEPFHDVHCDGAAVPMTSLQRETPARVRPAAVRQRLVELVAERFGFDRVSLFHTLPGVLPHPTRHAAATRS
jgi:lipoyl(octanoyl) transferase